MSVEVLVNAVSGAYGAWSKAELASYLVNAGNYSSLQAAMSAIERSPEYWYNTVASFEASRGWTGYALKEVSGGAAEAVVSSTETALEVAQSTTLTAVPTEVSGGSIAIADVSGGAGTSFGLKGILSADVGIMSAAMAPLLGVSIGASMYEANPELWTKISQALLPYCYDDTTSVPFWATVDTLGNWECSVAKDIIDALKGLFTEEQVGVFVNNEIVSPAVTSPLTCVDLKQGDTVTIGEETWVLNKLYYTGTAIKAARFATGSIIAAASEETYLRWYSQESHGYDDGYECRTPYTKDGLTVWYASIGRLPEYSKITSLVDASARQSGLSDGEIAWYLLYGASVIISGYPVGTSKWEGNEITSLPSSDPIVAEDGTLIDTVPISLPYNIPDNWKPGRPASSQNPSEQPDPTATTDPDKQISPYIAPLPTPSESISPETVTQPNPQANPSLPTPPTTTFRDGVPSPPLPNGESPTPLLPSTPLPFSSNVGLITVYHPSAAELYAFESWLWVTYADATIDKIWNNPFDGVIALFELYCTPTDIGNRTIHCGFLDSQINSAIISRYTEIDCGTIGVPEWYGNYLDYSPYTKAHIYLPFIGIQELNPDDIVGHAVNVTYRIDEYNGSCIAMITVAKSTEVNGETVDYSNTMYQFSGNCAVELPLSGGSQASIKAGMMMADASQSAGLVGTGANLLGGIGSMLMGSLGGAISGVGAAATSWMNAQTSYLSNMLSGKSTVQKSGSFGASHGALGIKTPFITITRPKQIQVVNYEKLYGYPAHKMVTLGTCTGFVRCREVHVISPTATDEEKNLIEKLLKSGVYVTE